VIAPPASGLLSVLVVDDHEPNLILYAKVLGKIEGVETHNYTDPRAALAWAQTRVPALAVLDYQMPELDGLELVKRLQAIPGRESVPFLIVTANDDRALRRDAMQLGALGFLPKPVDPVEFLALANNVLGFDRRRRDAVTRADEQRGRVRDAETQLAERDAVLLDALATALRARDPALVEHGERVAALSGRLARRLKMSTHEVAVLERATRVHDVGKLAFPDRVLAGGQLAPGDIAVVRTHVEHARAILGGLSGELGRTAQIVATTHHERYDGAGYPGGLRGDAIPLVGRVVAVADAYCALTEGRPYRAALSPGHALGQIESQRGTAYDPRIVGALRDTINEGM
jgi:response regulator RpfG family c-di-GMP phosphodiesterase